MNNWSNNLKIGAGVAAAVVLAGIGAIVWAVGFQGSSTSTKQPAATAPGLGTESLEVGQSLDMQLGSLPSTVGGISGANVQSLGSLVSPGALNFSQPAGKNLQSFNFNLAGQNAASQFESEGIGQVGTSNLVPLDSLISPGDANFSESLPSGQSLNASLGASPNTVPSLEGGISLSSPSPTASVSSLVSPGEELFSQATSLEPGASITANLGAAPNSVPSLEGGISLASTAQVNSVDSLVTPANEMYSQSFETSQPLSFNVAGANTATPAGGYDMLNTSEVASVSSLVSPGSLMASQAFETTQSLNATGATANSLSKPVASLLNTRSTQSSNVAAAGRVGIIFCGSLANHRCSPQYKSSVPHTARQLLIGFLWQGIPAGAKVQLFFIDANKGQIFGKPTTAFRLPASSGGVILAGFKGPFRPFRLGVGVVINGKRLTGAAVISIV